MLTLYNNAWHVDYRKQENNNKEKLYDNFDVTF